MTSRSTLKLPKGERHWQVTHDEFNDILVQSTVCQRIMEAVQGQPEVETHRQIISLSQDSFYRELDEEDLKLAKKGHFNFDHPGNS